MIIGLTLGRYLSGRFVKTVLGVFLAILSLVYLVDFIEMLRRAINVPEASAGTIAGLSLLRIPAVGEQILPFAVLFGAMAAFALLATPRRAVSNMRDTGSLATASARRNFVGANLGALASAPR